MKELYLHDDVIISPLGFTSRENLSAIRNNTSALKFHKNNRFPAGGFFAGIIEKEPLHGEFSQIGDPIDYTKLEQMMLLAVSKILHRNPHIDLQKTALIISTTKGNIHLLEENSKFPVNRVYLAELGKVLKNFFQFKNEPIIVSNACISGGLALSIARRFINLGKFDQAVVVGGDLVSDFVVSGFQSFQAISEVPCKPFSKDRNGISLGEAAAAILVSTTKPKHQTVISLAGDASCNDANHISGPSRTGEGLVKSITESLLNAGIKAGEVGYVCAHGTATVFNDEMEAIALHRLGMQDIPVNSYKGYYGHTLGASALVESILTKHALLNSELHATLNFEENGVSKPLNVIEKFQDKTIDYALKTASGFGGGNLALLFKKKEVDV